MTFEKRKDIKAISITAGVHILLLLFFLLFRYTMPAQEPVEEMGMEVNLGTSDNGFGDDQPEDMDDPAANMIPVNLASPEDLSDISDKIAVSSDENASGVVLKKDKPKTQVRDNRSRPNTAPPSQTASPQAKYVYTNSSGKGGNSAQQNRAGGNEGIGDGDGDMGVPGGTPGASNYSGIPGSGNINHSLNNRRIISYPEKEAVFKNGGKVVFRITVNQQGVITESSVRFAANKEIQRLAIQKLKSVKFNAAPNARPDEYGELTFEFK